MCSVKAAAKSASAAKSPKPPKPEALQATQPVVHPKAATLREFVDIFGPQLYRSDPQQRIEVIRRGIPAASVGQLSKRMGVSKEHLINSLRLSRATINRKEREGTVLSSDESERVLGVETLIGMVQTMVEQSGDPAGFDAPRWVATWLAQPLPALGGATPASYMDTFEGQKLVAEILSMSQSGAYA